MLCLVIFAVASEASLSEQAADVSYFIAFDTQAPLAAQRAPTAGYRSIRLCVASSLLPCMNALVIYGTVVLIIHKL